MEEVSLGNTPLLLWDVEMSSEDTPVYLDVGNCSGVFAIDVPGPSCLGDVVLGAIGVGAAGGGSRIVLVAEVAGLEGTVGTGITGGALDVFGL